MPTTVHYRAMKEREPTPAELDAILRDPSRINQLAALLGQNDRRRLRATCVTVCRGGPPGALRRFLDGCAGQL